MTEDCCGPSGLLSLDAALDRLATAFAPVAEPEITALSAALDRVLAADMAAPLALPPFNNSAVDGYALRQADLAADGWTRLPVVGRITAGQEPPGPLPPASAMRIFTGAPLPPGADLVIMQEDVRLEAGAVLVPAGAVAGQHCRRVGEDVAAGTTVWTAGRRLKPGDIALAAALGLAAVPVRRRLRIALISTGDELVEPAGALQRQGQVRDSNRPMLAALLGQYGALVSDLGIIADDPALVRRALSDCKEGHDLILTSGGMSVGEEDHVKAAFLALGGSLDFWKIAIKPGKPLALGRLGDTAFCGLPGNPAASFVTFHLLVRPLLDRLSGADIRPPPRLPIACGFTHAKKAGRREFLRVRLVSGPDGHAVAMPAGEGPGAALASLAGCDGLLDLAESLTRVEIGDRVPFLPL